MSDGNNSMRCFAISIQRRCPSHTGFNCDSMLIKGFVLLVLRGDRKFIISVSNELSGCDTLHVCPFPDLGLSVNLWLRMDGINESRRVICRFFLLVVLHHEC